MKKIFLSLIAVVSIMSADQSENKIFCTQLNDSFPSIVKVGLDTFAIRDGKASKCEDHSKEEWEDVAVNSPIYGYLLGLDAGLNGSFSSGHLSKECMASVYNTLVNEAISSKVSSVKGVIAIADKIASTPGMTIECSKEVTSDKKLSDGTAKELSSTVVNELSKTASSDAGQKLASYYRGLSN